MRHFFPCHRVIWGPVVLPYTALIGLSFQCSKYRRGWLLSVIMTERRGDWPSTAVLFSSSIGLKKGRDETVDNYSTWPPFSCWRGDEEKITPAHLWLKNTFQAASLTYQLLAGYDLGDLADLCRVNQRAGKGVITLGLAGRMENETNHLSLSLAKETFILELK